MSPLLTLSATELARRIRAGELTAREVLETHLAHAARVNPAINAIVVPRFAAARAEADEADARLRREGPDALPPLHGVPCTIKESFAVAGMPQTAGLVARAGYRAPADAPTVRRLREAGAIAMGVTNTSELCMWMESHNRLYGRTGNAYDPRRIAGGSSGGEGAIVGSGASPFGLGADVGGSIRMPAFFNGVFGHKPTGGLVPNTGQFPVTDPAAMRILATGPIARRAEDLFLLLRILAGPDGEDTGCAPMPLRDPRTVDLSRLRVLDVEDDGRTPVSAELRAAQRRAAEHLRSLGADVQSARFAELRHSLEIWSSVLQEKNPTPYAELMGQGKAVPALPELLRWLTGRSPHTLPSIGLAGIEQVTKRMTRRSARMRTLGEELRASLVSALGENGVLLYPSHRRVAPRHNAPLFPPTDFVYTAILNAIEVPATQVPLGLDEGGLPLGVQVAAAHGNDHLTLAVALALEQAFGGWVPPWTRSRSARP